MDECLTDDIWFDIEGAMRYLKVSRTTLYAAMKDGRLPFYYVKGTRQRRLKKDDLEHLMVLGNREDDENDET
ncbi:MAG: helix-turn-helix domain-containing protein [Caldilineaceae bacterium]|nr:helix-turn-helix domain-containing protein [Caldilineaceae bacterium]